MSNAASLERRIARLEDVQEIEQLQYEYAAAIDEGLDLDRLVTCFTPEGRWTANGFSADCRGRDEIRAFFSGIQKIQRQALHYTTQLRVSVADGGDTARVQAYLLCEATLLRAEGSDEAHTVYISSTYDNRCTKVGGTWLFEHVSVTRRHLASAAPAPVGIAS
jgi:ketosteroid isomerase-like protein